MSSLDATIDVFYQQELASGRKRFFPNEPVTNKDGLRTPNFIASPTPAQSDSLRNRIFNQIGAGLSDPNVPPDERFSQNELNEVMGNVNNAVAARFLVIHDRAADNVIFNRANITASQRGVHLFMDHMSNFFRQNDYDQPGHATKFERALGNTTDPRFLQDNLWPANIPAFQNRGVQPNHFIHVEMTATTVGERIRSDPNRDPGYTRKQVLALALAYVTASLRRGLFLTVTVHREVDRGLNEIQGNNFRFAHSDPRNFEISAFYRTVNEVLFGHGMSVDARRLDFTYGIDANRMSIDNAGNNVNTLHTFPSQYGPRQVKPNNWNAANTIIIKCDANRFRIVDPIIPNPRRPRAQVRRSGAYIFSCGGG